jgi:hypothetical protein
VPARVREIEEEIKRLEKEKQKILPHRKAKVLRFPDGGIEKLRGATYATYYRALGSTESLKKMKRTKSPGVLDEDLDDGNAPAAFYSTVVLGRAKWPGVKPQKEIEADLNKLLQYKGREKRGFDWREEYPHWEETYEVVEFIGSVPVRIYRKRGRQS